MPKVLGHGGRKAYRLTNAASRNAVNIPARHLAAVRLPWAYRVRGMNREQQSQKEAEDGAHEDRISGQQLCLAEAVLGSLPVSGQSQRPLLAESGRPEDATATAMGKGSSTSIYLAH